MGGALDTGGPGGAPAIHMSRIVERGARAHPERLALGWQEKRISYGELGERTEAVAARLARAGLGPGSQVLLIGRNSVEQAVCLIALMRYGFVAIPLNWRLADEALVGTAAKYEPEAVLYGSAFEPQAQRLRDEVGVLALPIEEIAGSPTRPIALPAEFGELTPSRADVYAFISTGGTTGVPKGVPVTNGMVEACALTHLCASHWTAADVLLFLPQLFHNPHFYVVMPLLVGATTIVPEMTSFDAELLLRTIERERVSIVGVVSTMLTYMREAQAELGVDVSSLRRLCYGGSPFSEATLRRTMEVFDCELVQFYGQTETSILVTSLSGEEHRQALEDEALRHRLRSAGRLVPLMEMRVVDEAGRDCPRDRASVGEVAVRGPSVMSGYWNDEERTAETIRDGWCYTGDLGTWDEDGYLYIVDRRQDMIISGGENIYPQAVEEVIEEHPAVAAVAVVGVPDPQWGELVTAAIVVRDGAACEAEEIQELCAVRLARYMLPRRIEFVAELPSSPTGRVLRRDVRSLLTPAAAPGGRAVGEI